MSSVIELGLIPGDAPEPPARPRRLRVPPRTGVVVVAVLCALTLTGSALPRSRAPLPLWSIRLDVSVASSFAVTGDGVYVLTGTSEGRRLTAYDRRTGVSRWSVPVARLASSFGLVRAGVIQLAVEPEPAVEWQQDGSRVSRTTGRRTIGIDAATGRQLWMLPGDLSFTRDGLAVAADWDETGSVLLSLRIVDVRSGATVWTHPARGLSSWGLSDTIAAGRVVTAAPGGRVEVRDLADGRLVASRLLPQLARTGPDDAPADLGVAGDLVLLQEQEALTAYDATTLRERWRLGTERFQGSYGCAPILCVTSDSGTAGVDPATGRQLWRRPGSGLSIDLGAGVVLDQGNDGSRSALIDTATGRTLVDLGSGGVAWNDGEAVEPLPVLLPTRDPAGRTAAGRLDQRTGRVTWLGTIDPVGSFACRSAGAIMACVTGFELTVIDLAP